MFVLLFAAASTTACNLEPLSLLSASEHLLFWFSVFVKRSMLTSLSFCREANPANASATADSDPYTG